MDFEVGLSYRLASRIDEAEASLIEAADMKVRH
jgi:hypothetical protein